MATTRKILVATTNPGKITELSAMLEADVKWVNLADFSDIAEVPEDGLTFTENACKKAIGYAKATGLWTIADDSGLVIDALQGGPGIESARFCGEESEDRKLIDHKNITKVLKLLEGVPSEKRTARFVCSLCLARPVRSRRLTPLETSSSLTGLTSNGASPEEILIETQGTLEGLIISRPVGENGFGYDPIFFVPRLNKTVAQLTAEQKNAISHRGNAIRKLKPLLNQLLETEKKKKLC